MPDDAGWKIHSFGFLGGAQVAFHVITRAMASEEVCINGFPVDMLVGEKVCVEIDGPWHYVYSNQPGLYESATGKENPVTAWQLQKYQRAKDHFMDHLLEKYG